MGKVIIGEVFVKKAGLFEVPRGYFEQMVRRIWAGFFW